MSRPSNKKDTCAGRRGSHLITWVRTGSPVGYLKTHTVVFAWLAASLLDKFCLLAYMSSRVGLNFPLLINYFTRKNHWENPFSFLLHSVYLNDSSLLCYTPFPLPHLPCLISPLPPLASLPCPPPSHHLLPLLFCSPSLPLIPPLTSWVRTLTRCCRLPFSECSSAVSLFSKEQ